GDVGGGGGGGGAGGLARGRRDRLGRGRLRLRPRRPAPVPRGGPHRQADRGPSRARGRAARRLRDRGRARRARAGVTLLAELSRELASLAAHGAAGVVGLEHRRGQGSGVILSADGYGLTNAHVAGSGSSLRVRLPGASVAPAELVGADPRTDLAVVRMPRPGPRPLELADSRRLQVGQLVMAIGN